MPVGYGRKLPYDSKMAREISRSPAMVAEQGGSSAYLADWGGASTFRAMAKAPVEARVVYYAVKDNLNDEASIEVATGLSRAEISRGKDWLVSRGYISNDDIVNEGGL